MPRLPRSVPSLFACLYLFGCQSLGGGDAMLPPGGAVDPSGAAVDDAHQIHWERSLDDALALSLTTHRPVLLAVNMDGESASDRIVHEEYRDPKFVAASRSYICVVASLFRHNPRDFDDQGNRIPCPRLGCCTCGEHIVNEPAMFQSLLADGERVAPRHAVISPDGKKGWDLSLSFDLQDIDRAVIETAKKVPPPVPLRVSGWKELANQRSDRGRALLERAIATTNDEAELGAALEALAEDGDAGSIDALRLIAVKAPRLSNALQQRFVATVKRLRLGVPMATVLREQIETIDPAGARRDAGAAWLPLLAQVDGESPATRSYLLACHAIGCVDGTRALSLAFGAPTAAAIETALGAQRPYVEFESAVMSLQATGEAPTPDPFTVEMPTAEALEADLDTLDRALSKERDNVVLRAGFAKASLDLARRRVESGGRDVALLLADAENNYAKVLDQQPGRADWWIERARCAYYRSEFAAEIEFARAALRAASGKTLAELEPEQALTDAATVEALRWLGDGCMNRHGQQLATDPAGAAVCMAEALRALGLVALSPFADDNDWTSFSSSHGAFGLWRAQFATASVGALRVPAGS
ncbi:MAG: hypothetical protein KDC48_12195, partial [Planctomycetes bacterium]|nr:hypothetical protein [Planctomycetota bacterium]